MNIRIWIASIPIGTRLIKSSNDLYSPFVLRYSGILYKRVYCKGRKFIFHSDNPEFEPYEVKGSNIIEVWRYEWIYNERFEPENIPQDTVKDLLLELTEKVSKIDAKLLMQLNKYKYVRITLKKSNS